MEGSDLPVDESHPVARPVAVDVVRDIVPQGLPDDRLRVRVDADAPEVRALPLRKRADVDVRGDIGDELLDDDVAPVLPQPVQGGGPPSESAPAIPSQGLPDRRVQVVAVVLDSVDHGASLRRELLHASHGGSVAHSGAQRGDA